MKYYIKRNNDFFLPPLRKNIDWEVAAKTGHDDMWVCISTAFCIREAGRNACPCRGAQIVKLEQKIDPYKEK